MKDELLDRIDKYLREEMSPQERSDFEKEIGSDPELRKEIDLNRDIIRALASRQEKLDFMNTWKAHSERSTRRLYLSMGVVGFAASLLIGIWVIKPQFSSRNPDITLEYGQGSMIFRGGSSSDEVNDLLRSGGYERALAVIDSLEISYKEPASEYIPFDSLSEEMLYRREVERLALYYLKWQRIQALIGLRKYDEALDLLGEFRKEKGELQEKADSVWSEIKHVGK